MFQINFNKHHHGLCLGQEICHWQARWQSGRDGALCQGQELWTGFVSSPGCSYARGTLPLSSQHLLLFIVTRWSLTEANEHPRHKKEGTLTTSPACYHLSLPKLQGHSCHRCEPYSNSMPHNGKRTEPEQRERKEAGQGQLCVGHLSLDEDQVVGSSLRISFEFHSSENQWASLAFSLVKTFCAKWYLSFFWVSSWTEPTLHKYQSTGLRSNPVMEKSRWLLWKWRVDLQER